MVDDTNIVAGIVKILENPKYKIYNTNVSVTKFRVQFPQFKNTSIVHLTFWGKLANDVSRYYKINDYILIEGSISIRKKKSLNSPFISKKVEVTVSKVYPLLLS
jgi:single-stranded DNA-binding protein